MKKKLLLAGVLKMLSGLLVMGLLLFVPAGTWCYPGGWRLMALLFLSVPLVLGSAVALVPFLAIPWVLLKRIRNEEQVLETGLPGYASYRNKVKYRLIPFLW